MTLCDGHGIRFLNGCGFGSLSEFVGESERQTRQPVRPNQPGCLSVLRTPTLATTAALNPRVVSRRRSCGTGGTAHVSFSHRRSYAVALGTPPVPPNSAGTARRSLDANAAATTDYATLPSNSAIRLKMWRASSDGQHSASAASFRPARQRSRASLSSSDLCEESRPAVETRIFSLRLPGSGQLGRSFALSSDSVC